MIRGDSMDDIEREKELQSQLLEMDELVHHLLDQEDLSYFKESRGFKNPIKTKLKNEKYRDQEF